VLGSTGSTWAARGIAVADMPDKLTEDAADVAIGAIVVLQRHLMADDRSGVSALYTVLLPSHVASLIN
jgi:lactate dehydrogenase-like 2-hydroxyacid dehydrogenase